MSIGIYLRCDRCGRVDQANAPSSVHAGPDRPPGHVLRAQAKSRGWKIAVDSWAKLSGQGWRDFCAECMEEG